MPCNESYPGKFECSCIDCAASCPAGDPPTAEAVGFEVAGLNGVTFTVAIVFGLMGIAVVLIGVTCRPLRDRRWAFRVPACFAGAPGVNAALTAFFGWWGRSCARHPVLTLAVCSWLVAALAFGVQYLVIVTEPVELWASPDSQTRLEKDYFDERFGPFFRTNQVFVKPLLDERIVYESYRGENVTFGPAFNRTFMRAVFEMQMEIERLGEEDDEGMEHLCFAPVTEVGASPERSKCTVQSAFGYLKNNIRMLESEDYLETMDECIG